MWTDRFIPPGARANVASLTLLLVGAGTLAGLLWAGRWLTFWYDEWTFILTRADPAIDTFLAPHVDHLSLVPVVIYQVLLRCFGLESYWPYLLVTWTMLFASVALLHRIVERRGGRWIGLLAAGSLLTLGPAFEDVLHAFQMSFLASTAAGLLAIDRLEAGRSRSSATLAALVLCLAVASSSVGVLFTGLIVVWGVVAGNRIAIIAALPAIVGYTAWYLAWRHATSGPPDSSASFGLLLATFAFGAGASASAILGLAPYAYAPYGLIIGCLGAARAYLARWRPGALGTAAAAAFVAQQGLQAVFRSEFGVEHAARSAYLFPGAIFLWLLLADSLPRDGPRTPARVGVAIVVAASVLAVAGNVAQFRGAATAMRQLRIDEVAQLNLLERLRGHPNLALAVSPDEELMPQVSADPYFAAIDRFGSPAIAARPDVWTRATPARLDRAAVTLLASGITADQPTSVDPGGSLKPVDTSGKQVLILPDGCTRLSPGARAILELADGATGFAVSSGRIAEAPTLGITQAASAPIIGQTGRESTRQGVLRVPPLPEGLRWYVGLRAAPDGLTACPVR